MVQSNKINSKLTKKRTRSESDEDPLQVGFIKLPRDFFHLITWTEKREFTRAEAFLDILQLVSYTDNNQGVINGKLCYWGKDQYPASIRFLAERWGRSKDWVGNFLTLLEKQGMIKRLQNAGQTTLQVTWPSKRGRDSGHLETIENTSQLSIPEIQEVELSDTLADAHKDSDQDSDQDKIKKDKESKEGKEVEYKAPQLLSLKDQYNSLEKNSQSIGAFISDHRPAFHEPYQDLWNLFAKQYEKTTVKDFTSGRKAKLKARLGESLFDFYKILKMAAQSSFLLKKESMWFKLDWILKNDTNYVKVLEGDYVNVQERQEVKQLTPWQLAQEKALKIFGPASFLEINIKMAYESGDLGNKLSRADPDTQDFVYSLLDSKTNPGYSHAECFRLRQEKRRPLA